MNLPPYAASGVDKSASRFVRASSTIYSSLVEKTGETWFLDDTTFIYRQDWCEQVVSAWNLAEPPSPKEVVSHMQWCRSSKSIMLGVAASECELGVLWAYCLSTNDELTAMCFDMTVDQYIATVISAIHNLMSYSNFLLWALGTDLRPVAYSNAAERYIARIMELPRVIYNTPGTRWENEARKAIIASAYIQCQLNSGTRINPIHRRCQLQSGFDSMVDKIEAERNTDLYVFIHRQMRKIRMLEFEARYAHRGDSLTGQAKLAMLAKISSITITLPKPEQCFTEEDMLAAGRWKLLSHLRAYRGPHEVYVQALIGCFPVSTR